MKVLVIGATGFTGSYLTPLLIEQGMEVRCMVRPSSDASVLPKNSVEVVYGDVKDAAALAQAAKGMGAMIHIPNLLASPVADVVEAAAASGIRRAVFVSTTSIFTTLDSQVKARRLVAEEIIRSSSLEYTILRPTMIYGSSRDRNIARLIRFLRRYRCMPVFGDGGARQQPVYVGDVAAAIARVLCASRTSGQSYNIAGAEPVTFDEMIDAISSTMGKRVFKLRLPLKPFVAACAALERMSIRPPVKAEQLLRMNEPKVFDNSPAARDFGYAPLAFRQGVSLELKEMALA